ncbi:MAG TPA: hypothetical protein HPP80_09835 [Rhodospirillaceae bacterium]|nr:hypothetical protein [Rhodospirillaceae bacterium]
MTITKKPAAPAKKATQPAVKPAPAAKTPKAGPKKLVKTPAPAPDAIAAAFIQAADHPPASIPAEKKLKNKSKEKPSGKDKKKKKKDKKKEAVIIRFEDEQLGKIDLQAEKLGLSRAAWVRMIVAKALSKK